MAALWIKDNINNDDDESSDKDVEDIWDDTALIEAYDKAIQSYKSSLESGNGKDSAQIKKQKQTKKSKSSKKKESSHLKIAWNVGDICRAIYYADGLVYDGQIIDIQKRDGTCTVRFDFYENEEIVNIEDVFQKDHDKRHSNGIDRKHDSNKNRTMQRGNKHANDRIDTRKITSSGSERDESANNHRSSHRHSGANFQGSSSLTIGDVCLAVNPRTGRFEEAVITNLNAGYSDVTFTTSMLKERVSSSSLRNKSSKRTLHQHKCPKHQMPDYHKEDDEFWFPGLASPFFPPSFIPQMPLFPHPPFSPWQGYGLQNSYGNMPKIRRAEHGLPPPPPPPPAGLPINAENVSDDALASMLMSWYMVGYHTGYYQGLKQGNSGQPSPKHSDNIDPVETQSTSSSKPEL
ncbi:survival motor neuron protein-like isoform X1 [Rhopilema esculentum]|uniref:survival motor neuron protein-like isoform X1 n=1 Tax=Rhopilema esculentum TaxID=499914 RepID=UPI0031DA0D96